ncbi:hypothetical protein GJAV_G00059840 [Gymnothorax javanicus]|nr:hypothetical protein GJAV_G00059840 [Gymnothorax javanicus]
MVSHTCLSNKRNSNRPKGLVYLVYKLPILCWLACVTGHMTMDLLHIIEIAQEEIADQRQGAELKVFKERTNPFEEYSDTKFVKPYRISKESYHYILDLIEADIDHPTRRNHALLPVHQLCIALRFYAYGAFQMVVGDTCGVSQATCCQVVRRVTEAICARKNHFIRFPQEENERRAVIQGFHVVDNFPEVIGAIDGTHIAIVNPGGINAARFYNRKCYVSLNCQFVCNHLMQFSFLSIGIGVTLFILNNCSPTFYTLN